MEAWTKVRWSEASQIAAQMDLADAALPEPGVAPQEYYRQTRDGGDLETAALFLGHALPRYEGVAWAARQLDSLAGETEPSVAARQILDRSLRWLEDPTDDHRRAAFDAYEAAGEESPERLLALAVFMTGGSIAPPDLPPVLPDPSLSGRLAACALIVAAHRTGDARTALERMLDAGEQVAARGLEG